MAIFQPRRILVPTDFSEAATAALRLAVLIGSNYQSTLVVLHADGLCPPPELLIGDSRAFTVFREQGDALRKRLDDYVAELVPPGLRAQAVVENTSPAAAILRLAVTTDLVVMGTHGRAGFDRLLLGSCAEEVLRKCAVPVVTVRAAAPERIETIVCPVDYSPVSARAVRVGADLADAFGSSLMVVYFAHDNGRIDFPKEAQRLDQWVRKTISRAAECRILLRHGEAARDLLEYLSATGCGFLVLAAEHHLLADRAVLGTSARTIIRAASCPVLVLSSLTTAGEQPLITEEELAMELLK